MRIRLIAVGSKMPGWVIEGYNEYAKRLPQECSLQLREIALAKRGKNADIARAKAQEGQQMLAAIERGDTVVALDVKGKPWSTEKLAAVMADWQMQGNHISLLVGGPDGLADECLQRADLRWSLSALTLPHPLVRIVLAEQIYRGWTLLNNHPYHR